MESTSQLYTPGVCNINLAEVAYRKRLAYKFLSSVVVFVVVSVVFSFHYAAVSATFILSFIAILNYLQARDNFCVMYAKKKIYSSSQSLGDVDKITDEQDAKDDETKSHAMYMRSALISTIISLVHTGILVSL